MEGVTVDLEVIHTQHLVAAAFVAALSGGHEDPLPDLDVMIVKEDGELLVAVADGLVGLIHDAQVEGELRLPGGRGQDVAALVGREDDSQALMLCPEPIGDLVGRGVTGYGDVLALHDHVILVGLAGRLIATDADPIDVDVVGGAFTGPHLQGLLDQGEAGDGDDDALGPEGLCQEPGREALAGAAGHDELTTGGLALGEVLQAVTDGVLLVGTGRAGLQDRRLVRELGPQLVEELGVELLPGVQGAEADPLLVTVEAGDTFRRRADQGEGEALAGLERQAREGGDVRVRQLLVRVLTVLTLDRPELALVGLGYEVDALVGRRQL